MNLKNLAITALLIVPFSGQADFLLYGDLSNGGDTLAEASGGSGGSAKVKAGGLLQLSAGYRHNISDDLSLDGLIGFKFDKVSTENDGSADFTRFPLEIGLRKAFSEHNIGAGLSHHLSAKYSGPRTSDISFKDSTGYYAYYGYEMNTNVIIGLKYTAIEYQSKSLVTNINNQVTNSVDGNNIAIFGSITF